MKAGTFCVALNLDALDRGRQRNACGAESRQDAKKQTRENGNADGEAEHAQVHGKVEKYLSLFRGNESDQQHTTPLREQNSQQRACSRKQNAFSEHLADQSGAGSAERQAHCDLFLSGGSAGEKKAGDIGASDQQNKRDDDHEHFERPLVLATEPGKAGSGRDLDECSLQEVPLHFGLPVRRNRCGEDLGSEHGKACVGLFAGLAGSLAGHDAQPPRCAFVEKRILVVDDGLSANRDRHVEASAHIGAEEIGRRYANHRKGMAVELNLRADRASRAAVMLLPESVAQDRRAATSARVVGRVEKPAEQRLNSERREISPAGVEPVEVLNFSAVGEIELLGKPGQNAGENILVVAQLLPNRVRVGVANSTALLWRSHSE